MKIKYYVWFFWKECDGETYLEGSQEIGGYSSEEEAQKALMDDTMRYREMEGWTFDDDMSAVNGNALIWWDIIMSD